MRNRFKELRKALGLNLTAFADSINVSKSFVSLYENGEREISNRTIQDICRIHNVNEIWLRTGEGDMFNPLSREEEIALLINKLASDEDEAFRLQLIKIITNLTSDQLEVIKQVAIEIAKENSPD